METISRLVLAPVLVALPCAPACAETRRSLGEDCLKDEQCLSGVCSQLVCAASPPLTDLRAAAPSDGSSAEAADETSVDAGVDTEAPAD